MDDDDDDQGAGLGLDDLQQGVAQRSCQQCGGTSFFDNGIGELSCYDCGAVSHETRQLVQEDGNGRDQTGRAGNRRRRMRVLKASKLPAHHLFNTLDFLSGLQQVLADHCKQVSTLCSIPLDIATATIHGVWQRYVGKQASGEGDLPPVQLIEGRLHSNGESMYYAYLATVGRTPPQIPAFSLSLLAAVTCAGCRLLNLPVHAGTIAQWCTDGKLTWMNAFRRLPQELQVTLRAAGLFFMPASPPSPNSIERALHVLCVAVGLDPLPQLNVPLCAVRLMNRMHVPDSVLPVLLDLYALDRHDREHRLAYVSLTQPDELERLRRQHAQDSGAYVAGLVVAAMTATAEWEEWVDCHILPAGVPSTWTASTLTTDDVEHMAASVLQGGDAFVGRGSDHYKGIVYRGMSTVTVRDPVLAQQLEQLGVGTSTAATGAAALNADSRAALASAAKLASSQGRATTSTDLYALLLGSQATRAGAVGLGTAGGGNMSMLGASQATSILGLSQSGAGAARSTGAVGASYTPAALSAAPMNRYSQSSLVWTGAGAASSQSQAMDLLDEEEFMQGREVTASLGPRLAQPGFDTVERGQAWPIKALHEVGEHTGELAALHRHPALQEGSMDRQQTSQVSVPLQALDSASPASTVLPSMPVMPRGWQAPKEVARHKGRLPTHSPRPTASSMRWQALVSCASSLEGCDSGEVASHYDAFTLLIQLYTPLPGKGASVNAVMPISTQPKPVGSQTA